MPLFDECCVLIPCSTLEDFPRTLADHDARSLLAAWTALWHPQLLATTKQIPAWSRADSPPEPGGQLFAAPSASMEMLPAGFESRAKAAERCIWLVGSSREEFITSLNLDPLSPLSLGERQIAVEDFYAAGFVNLQIQIMTRRLRYTSNLDVINFQNQIVDAARAFVERDATTAIESMHNVFDCLAEERDHYFTSDPHLIDLTLVTGSTVAALARCNILESTTNHDRTNATVLPVPGNVLIDADAADGFRTLDSHDAERLRTAIAEQRIGWAGGGPAPTTSFDAMTLAQSEAALDDARKRVTEAVGSAPVVYGRYSGSTPIDLTSSLSRAGYRGLIPLDFAGGSGFGDEAKVVYESGGVEIDALTARPIDAASDAAFLSIGSKLGESIDSGEISTGLFVHWPGQGCDSFHDLRRAASWSLALGRFWTLEDYFVDGEKPYHHGTGKAASSTSSNHLTNLVTNLVTDPISAGAASFREAIRTEQASRTLAISALVAGDRQADDFATAIGASKSKIESSAVLLLNPDSTARRTTVALAGSPDTATEHIYAASHEKGQWLTSVDIPAFGFAVAKQSEKPPKKGFSLSRLLGGRFFGGSEKPIVRDTALLENEFMEVALSESNGGISGVYSGLVRGNRFSLKLVAPADDRSGIGNMTCDKITVLHSTPSLGTIETTGTIRDNDNSIANYVLRFSLQRGSRFVELDGEIQPIGKLDGDPWTNYIAARGAVSTESAIARILLRDKIHRAASRKLVAPLGVIFDESERQTLVTSDGAAYHKRVGDRFLDTLIAVKGESQKRFRLCYGFDVPSPLAAAKQQLTSIIKTTIQTQASVPDRGWILHTSPKDIHVPSLAVARRDDGRLAAIVRMIQSRPKSAKTTIAFCRDIEAAIPIIDQSGDLINLPVPTEQAGMLTCEGDRVSINLSGHQVLDLLVIFQ